MKVIILGDLHAGEKDGNVLLCQQQLSYLNMVVMYAIANNITDIILTGDVFDVRRTTNNWILSEWKDKFFDVCKRENLKLHIIVGNHDMYYRDQINPNTVTEHLHKYPNISIYDTPEIVTRLNMLMVPWICKENESECLQAINDGTNQKNLGAVLGHFEIIGAQMEGAVCTKGLAQSDFKGWDLVLSGHFHAKGEYGNIQYVGTPYQMNWGDYGHDKGFHIFDTETLDLEFIQNHDELFRKIIYRDDLNCPEFYYKELKDLHVKIVIEQREDIKKYESFFLKVENAGCASLDVVEPYIGRTHEDSYVELENGLEVAQTADVIKQFTQDLYPEKVDKLTPMMLAFYQESVTL